MTKGMKCPICDSELKKFKSEKETLFSMNCSICGTYLMDKAIMESDQLADLIKRHKRALGGMIRYLNLTQKKTPHLTARTLKELIKSPIVPKLQDIEGKLSLLLSAMKMEAVIPGHTCNIYLETDYPLAFAWDKYEFESLLISLEEDGLIEYRPEDTSIYRRELKPTTFKNRNDNRAPLDFSHYLLPDRHHFLITRKGWNFANFTEPNSQGFIAIDFNDSMNEAIQAIEQGITDCGYVPMTIKNKEYPETIMEKALGEIRRSLFVVVDITNLRPSVFYEAGFAHAIGKPVFYVCSSAFRDKLKRKRKELEFYTKHYKIRTYKDAEELKRMIIILIEANFPLKDKE